MDVHHKIFDPISRGSLQTPSVLDCVSHVLKQSSILICMNTMVIIYSIGAAANLAFQIQEMIKVARRGKKGAWQEIHSQLKTIATVIEQPGHPDPQSIALKPWKN